jgi:uncharacterized protein YuzE
MTRKSETLWYELSVCGSHDGAPEAAYIRFREGKVARTREVVEDTLLADYNSKGKLVGVEILGPVSLTAIARLLDEPRRKSLRRFLRLTAPPALVTT